MSANMQWGFDQEARARSLWLAWTGQGKLIEMPTYAIVDAYGEGPAPIEHYWLEIKAKRCTRTAYRLVRLERGKYDGLRKLADFTQWPVYLLVVWRDGAGYVDLARTDPLPARDPRYCYLDRKKFTWIDDACFRRFF